MNNRYDCLVVNGDSYSASNQLFPVWGDIIASELGIPIINSAVIGSSNDRILRSTIETVHVLEKDSKKPLIMIGWSFIGRSEIWYDGQNKELQAKAPDQWSSSVHERMKFVTLDWISNAGETDVDLKHITLFNTSVGGMYKKLVDFYTDLYLLAELLTHKKIDYRFFSAAQNTNKSLNTFKALQGLHMVKCVVQDPMIWKLHEFCILDWAKTNDLQSDTVTGHLSQDGHRKFAAFLMQNLNL